MNRIFLASVLIPVSAIADSDSDYVNFIRQIQQDSGLEWDVTVLPTGDGLISPTGVSSDGSFFELWSIHSTTVSEHLLDEQFVTSYTPNAVVDIITGDPYQAVRRTRCDQPFQVRVTVTGLLDPADPAYPAAPDAAKMVDYIHTSFSYPDGTHSLEGVNSPVGSLVGEGTMVDNTVATVTFNVTNLTGIDLTQVEGEEIFSVSAQADFGVSSTILDSERVQIWPIARATISGYDPTYEYDTAPRITVQLFDLYPSSKTYMRVYPGPQISNPANAVTVSASVVVIEDSIPQDRTLVLKELDRYFVKHGAYTMEILHETPFGIDLIQTGTILLDRKVEVNGSLFTE